MKLAKTLRTLIGAPLILSIATHPAYAFRAPGPDSEIVLSGLEEAFGIHEERLEAIIDWIGRPSGREQIVSESPEFGVERSVRTFEANGERARRRIRILKILGSGLAGTVYLVEDIDSGMQFVEKHYGALPKGGTKRLGQFLADGFFALTRQAPLSYRELPEAALAIHLANRFLVTLSKEKFGRAITPPILYTRYDEKTGGYVHAFPYIEGRPLRPWNEALPLFGEASLFTEAMRKWRDFLANDLGFWGMARQVDPANLNAYSNLWITPDHHVVLLDVVPGVPGLEPRYLWWGLARGEFPPFADAMNLEQLSRSLQGHSSYPEVSLAKELALMRVAVERWKDSEPRLLSSPQRVWKFLRDDKVKRSTRAALLTHLEIKGAITREQASEYRALMDTTGRFPKWMLHSLFKMAPLSWHRFWTDGRYALEVLSNTWRWPFNLAKDFFSTVRRTASFIGRSFRFIWRLLTDPQERLKQVQSVVGQWIGQEKELGRLTDKEAEQLEHLLQANPQVSDLSSLLVIHLFLKTIVPTGTGTASLALLIAALATGQWWPAIPAMTTSTIRFITTLWMTGFRYPGLLLFAALPSIGNLGAPIFLLRSQPELGAFMIRSIGQETAMHMPGFGERGSLTEMVGVAATQVLVVEQAPLLAPALVGIMLGIGMHRPWLIGIAAGLYGVSVLRSIVKRWSAPSGVENPGGWKFGLPERYIQQLPIGSKSQEPPDEASFHWGTDAMNPPHSADEERKVGLEENILTANLRLTTPNAVAFGLVFSRRKQEVVAAVWGDQVLGAREVNLGALAILGPRPAALLDQQRVLQAAIPALAKEVRAGVVVRSYADWSFSGLQEIVVSPRTLPQLLMDFGGLEEADLPTALDKIRATSDALGGMV
jgi:hypothetical protein